MLDVIMCYDVVGMAGHGRVVLEKVLVFAKSNSKRQPMRLYVLSGRRHGAVLKHRGSNIAILNVLSSKEPLRITMVGIFLNLPRFTVYWTSQKLQRHREV